MRALAVVAAFSNLILVGCISYVPPERSPDTSFQRFESRRLDDPALIALVSKGRAATAVEWNLDALTRAAIYLSPDLEVSRAKWRVSQAAVGTAARRPNPSLDASAGRATNPPNGESANLADVALGLRIETAGKRTHRIAQARALSESERLELYSAAWQLRGHIRDALLEWNAAEGEAKILERLVDVERSIAQMLERRVELGEAAMGEKARADVVLARAELDRAASMARIGEARSRLAQAVGVPLEAIAQARISFDGLDARSTGRGEPALRRALLERDDLRAQRERFTAADAAYRLEIAKQYPDLVLGPSYSYDMGINKLSVGVMSLALPASDRNRGPIAEARAHRAEAAARFEALRAMMLADLDRAQAAEHDAHARVDLTQSILQREQWQQEATERRFSVGEDDRLSLANARAAEYEAQRAVLAARFALQKSIAQVEEATRLPLFAARAAIPEAIETGDPR